MTVNDRQISAEAIQNAANMLRSIGHPVRLKIIELLDGEGELHVTAIYEALGLQQALASQHLSLMRDRGILASRREGSHVYYRIADPRVTKVIECIHDHCRT